MWKPFLAVVCLCIATTQGPAAQSAEVTALVGATLVDGTGGSPIENAVVVIRNGRIAEAGPAGRIRIPSGAARVDLRGKTLLPGFVNAHGHVAATSGLQSGDEFYTRENLERQLTLYAHYGVTSGFSLGDDGPAGIALRNELMREVSTFVYESTPEFFADPFFLRYADRAALDQLNAPARQQQVRNGRNNSRNKAGLEQARRNLRLMRDAGVRIAMGTDTGPPARFQGYFEHAELAMMVEAGLTPMQAIVAATSDAAHCMRQDGSLGVIRPGAWADLAVYGASPVADIRNTHTLESVWIAGELVK